MKKVKFYVSSLVVFFLLGVTAIHASDEEIKIGAPLALTGIFASDGVHYLKGIELAVDEINRKGGLLGKKLSIVKFDVQEFAPERVMLAADQLVGREKVDIICAGWGGWGQDVRAYGKYDVPVFLNDSSMLAMEVFREAPEKYSNVFQLAPTEKRYAKNCFNNLMKIPYDFPNKKIALIAADDAFGDAMAAGYREIASENGWKVMLDERVPYGTTEWGPLLTKIRSVKPALIVMEIVGVPENATFIDQFIRNPTNTIIHQGYAFNLIDYVSNLKQKANGVLGSKILMPGPQYPNEETKKWADRFKEKFGEDPFGVSLFTYEPLMLWAEAVRAVGDEKDYGKICSYIRNAKFKKMAGGYIYFDKDQMVPTFIDSAFLNQIQNGTAVTLIAQSEPYKDNQFQLPPWIEK